MKKIFWLIVIVLVLLLGIFTFLFFNRDEEIVEIAGANFTLNELADKFLETEYATTNECKIDVKENVLEVKCDKKHVFEINNGYLVTTIDNEETEEVFKYIVDALQTFYGSALGDYEHTLDSFLRDEIMITDLEKNKVGDEYELKVYLLKQIQKYDITDVITKETSMNIANFDYIYSGLGYKIANMSLTYSDIINTYSFAGVISGDSKFDVYIVIKLYDNVGNVLVSHRDNFDAYDSRGLNKMAFVTLIKLGNTPQSAVARYSVALVEKEG